jgi:tetratricopeptide (TPR) repeat protein
MPKLDPRLTSSAIVETATALQYPPLETEVLLLLGESQVTSGFIDEAETTFYNAASAATRAGDDRSLIRAWIKIISLVIDYRGNTQEAARILELADAQLSRLERAPDLEAAVESARGQMLYRDGQYLAAKEAFDRAVAIAERASLNNRRIYLGNLSVIHISLLELDEAQQINDALYPEVVEEFGPDHPNVADVLWEMARIAERRSDNENAIDLQRQTIDIFSAAYGHDHPMLATLYQGLGWNLKEFGEFEEAHEVLNISLEIIDARPDDVEFFVQASVFNTLGDLYVSQDLDPQAREAFQRSIEIWESENPGNPQIVGPLSNLGMLENRQGRFDSAFEICQRVLEIDEASLSANHPDLGWSLVCIADAQLGKENWPTALVTLNRAESLLANVNAHKTLRAETKFLLARALWATGKKEQARELASESRMLLSDADPSYRHRIKQIDDWLATNGRQK